MTAAKTSGMLPEVLLDTETELLAASPCGLKKYKEQPREWVLQNEAEYIDWCIKTAKGPDSGKVMKRCAAWADYERNRNDSNET